MKRIFTVLCLAVLFCVNAAAQKKGLKMGDITQVSFGNNGAVNGFRVRKGTLNQQPQNTAIANAPATQAPTTRKI